MFEHDEEPLRKNVALRNLEPMSRSELTDYIVDLQAEIARVEGELKKKEAHANAASSLFGTKG